MEKFCQLNDPPQQSHQYNRSQLVTFPAFLPFPVKKMTDGSAQTTARATTETNYLKEAKPRKTLAGMDDSEVKQAQGPGNQFYIYFGKIALHVYTR